MSKRLWITWENHRRSKELALEFDAKYFPLVHEASRPVRYLVLTARTVELILREKPRVVFCQNPSIVLTTLLILLRVFFCYKLIVDRHSNFKLEYKTSSAVKWKIFHFLSSWTVRHADLTIVTNEDLKRVCNEYGGSAAVLQDKIPDFSNELKRPPPVFMRKMEKTQVMFVTMFDLDEPIDEIISASKALSGCVCYLTGNYKKYYNNAKAEEFLGFDIVLTGYISDDDYLSLMENSDLVVVLTKKDFILNCGGYEAIAMEKSLILSDTPTLRSYFGSAAKYSKCNAQDIEYNITESVGCIEAMVRGVIIRKSELKNSWVIKFKSVRARIERIIKG